MWVQHLYITLFLKGVGTPFSRVLKIRDLGLRYADNPVLGAHITQLFVQNLAKGGLLYKRV